MKMTGGKQTSSFRAQIVHSHSHWGKSKIVLLVKRVRVDSLSNCELMIGKSKLVHQQHVCGFDPGQNTQISFLASTGIFLCFPVVPVRICRSIRFNGTL